MFFIFIFSLSRHPVNSVVLPLWSAKGVWSMDLPIFFLERVSCGFPSPADDYVETALDLNELVIAHPAATFYVRVSGDSMMNAAICHGDIIVVDRAREPGHNSIVVAHLDGEFTVKRLSQRDGA